MGFLSCGLQAPECSGSVAVVFRPPHWQGAPHRVGEPREVGKGAGALWVAGAEVGTPEGFIHLHLVKGTPWAWQGHAHRLQGLG